MIKYYLLLAICIGVLSNSGYAQQLPDSTAYNRAVAYYLESTGEQSELFNGNEYNDVRADIGSVFFLDNKLWAMATLVYNGNVYKNVPLQYDSFNDIVISKRLNSPVKYALIPEKVLEFDLGDHHFIRVENAAVKNATKDGYYEKLYDGRSGVIVKRSKNRTEILSRGEGIKISFEDVDVFYVKKDCVFYPVKSRGDLLKLFNDKEDALKAFIKSAAIKFNENKAEAIVKLANYYDQLSL